MAPPAKKASPGGDATPGGTASPAEQARVAWQALPPRDRVELTKAATKGQRGINRADAAYMLWFATNELRRGPWPAMRIALIVVVALLVNQALVMGISVADAGGFLGWIGLIPVVLLIPFTSWTLRRPKLERSARLNAALLAGREFDSPPDPEASERLFALALKEGWLRGTRPQR